VIELQPGTNFTHHVGHSLYRLTLEASGMVNLIFTDAAGTVAPSSVGNISSYRQIVDNGDGEASTFLITPSYPNETVTFTYNVEDISVDIWAVIVVTVIVTVVVFLLFLIGLAFLIGFFGRSYLSGTRICCYRFP